MKRGRGYDGAMGRGRLAGALLGLCLIGGVARVPVALADGKEPLEVVRAYEAAWNARDLAAAVDLFADDGRAMVLGPLVDGLTTLAPRPQRSAGRLFLQWCAGQASQLRCRLEGEEYRVSGSTVTWRQRLYAEGLPPLPAGGVPPALPWETGNEATVEAGRIKLLVIAATPQWVSYQRLLQDQQAVAASATLAPLVRGTAAAAPAATQVAAEATAQASHALPKAPSTQQRATPTPLLWLGGAAAAIVTLVLASARRPSSAP